MLKQIIAYINHINRNANSENEQDNYKVVIYKVSVGRKALMEIKVYNINVSRIKDINNLYLVELNINRIVKDGIAERGLERDFRGGRCGG